MRLRPVGLGSLVYDNGPGDVMHTPRYMGIS